MRKSLIYIIVTLVSFGVAHAADDFFRPHQDLAPRDWNNLFEEMNQQQEEEEYQQQEARFDLSEAETREVLSTVRQFSTRGINLAELGTEQLENLRQKSFNSMMLEEHRRMEYALSILADQLDIELLANGRDPATARLNELNSMQFAKEYPDAVINLHAEMLAYLRRPSVRNLDWPVVKEILSDIENKVANLLELAHNLPAR